ncbi:MAG: IS3 family transposase [Pontiella sp.]|nr:IS3 family transposase [Pontiella sp.]
MKYAFVEAHRNQFHVRRMCIALRVSSSGYYAWRERELSEREVRHRRLIGEIRLSFKASHETYGAIRVTEDLRDLGESIGKNTVAYLMRREGLVPKTTRRFRRAHDAKHRSGIGNVLNRQFSVNRANSCWVSDITFIPTRAGHLHLCVVMDLHSRAVIGWSMSARQKSELVVDALHMAIRHRKPKGPVLVHSDQGIQYASERYRELLDRHGMVQSMSRKGNCWDNAVAESFFHSLKTERTADEKYLNHRQARSSIFDYIELFYNRRRKHSSLNYQAPLAYELNES